MSTRAETSRHTASGQEADAGNLEQEMIELSAVIYKKKSRHSNLYLWIEQRFNLLEDRRDGSATDWAAFAEYAARANVLDGKGRPPTASSMRTTWMRVKKNQKSKDQAKEPSATVQADQQQRIKTGEASNKQDATHSMSDVISDGKAATPAYQPPASHLRLQAATQHASEKKPREANR